MSDAGLFTSRRVTWSLPVPTLHAPVAGVKMAESRVWIQDCCRFFSFLTTRKHFTCLVIACSNRINMISIQCHRVGQWWAGKQEFENLLDSGWGNGVHIPFKIKDHRSVCTAGLQGVSPCCHPHPGTEGTCLYHTVMTVNSSLIKSSLNIDTLTSTRKQLCHCRLRL